MAERYLRWGIENGDLRDFRASLDQLHLANDRDAPMVNLVLRKYNCLSDVAMSAVESLLHQHQKVIDASIVTENDYRSERESILKLLTTARTKVRQLQDEGSLIKAKEEERKVAELELSAQHIQELIDSGEGRNEVYASYDKTVADAMRFTRELDQAALMVAVNAKLGPQLAESLSGQLRSRLEHIKSKIDAVNPAIPDNMGKDSEQADPKGRPQAAGAKR